MNYDIHPLVDLKITLYFRVHDANIFGGPGSVGYTSQGFDHCTEVPAADAAFVKLCSANTAKFLGVPEEAVEAISWQEYEAETDEQDEDRDWDENEL